MLGVDVGQAVRGKRIVSILNFFCICLHSRDTSASGFEAVILDLRLPLRSRSNERSAVELSVSDNTGVAGEVSLLSHVEEEIWRADFEFATKSRYIQF